VTTVPELGLSGSARPAPTAWRPALARSRASEQAVSGLGTLCLYAFLAAQFVSLTRLFFSQRLGEGFAVVASFAGILSVALLLPAVAIYGLRGEGLLGNLVEGARLWAAVVLGLAVFLFLFGWLGKGYRINAVVQDFCPYLVLVASVVLGSLSRVFRELDRPLVALLAAALVVNAIGMTQITDVVFQEYAEDRAGIGVVAYRTQGALAFWPLLFLTARYRRPWQAFLVYCSVFFVLGQQILFQKRGPTVRILLFVVVFLLVLPRLRRPGPSASGRRGWAAFASAGLLALVVGLGAAPWLLKGQLSGLLHRLSGAKYQGGAAGMLTWENERFFEAAMFLRTVQPEELVFGRGFGGYFVPSTGGWGTFSDDVGEVVRRQVHVGALMPFFKGGLALALAFYAGLAHALVRGRRFLGEPLAAAAFFVILVRTIFLVLEGWFIMSVSFDLVMVGLCMGYLLSRERGAGAARPLVRARVAGPGR
jgi:hypothetical protein